MNPSSLHFSAFGLAIALVALLAGCAPVPTHGIAGNRAGQPLARMDLPPTGTDAKASALLISAEFALQQNDAATAAADYSEAARLSSDPAISRRAIQLALATGDARGAQGLLERWQAVGAQPRELAMARGQLAMLSGDRTAAEREFEQALTAGDADAWKTFAAALLSARDHALAGRVLEDVATPARLPADAHVWVAVSELGEHLGRHAFARRIAEAAAQRFDSAETTAWAAGLRLAGGDRAGALAMYARGIGAHPRSVELRLAYATLLAGSNQHSRALQVLARGPQTQATWSARVAIAASAKDEPALRGLYSALLHAPAGQRADNVFLLGQLAEVLGHDHDALDWYAKVDPDSANGFDAQMRTAVLLDKAGQPVQAHALAVQLQQDYSDDPDNLRAAYELDAELYSRHGDHAQAIDAYDRGLAALPGDPELTYDRGIEEANAGDTDAALADFRKVLAGNPDNVDAMNALGFTLADADRDLPEATVLLRKALAAKPDAAAIMDSWGWLQFRLGNLGEAETYLDRAWGRQQDPDIGVHLGEVLWMQGQHARARAVFAKVRKLDPHNAALMKAVERLGP